MTEEQREEAEKEKRIFSALVASEGWKRLVEIAEVQAKARENEVLLKPTENTYLQEYVKGEIQGIKVFTKIPTNLLEVADSILKLAEQDDLNN